MTREEKIKKVIAAAVAYYVEQEKATLMADREDKFRKTWSQAGKAIQLNMKQMIQQRGSISRSRTLLRKEETFALS